jgi:hypothetical protein
MLSATIRSSAWNTDCSVAPQAQRVNKTAAERWRKRLTTLLLFAVPYLFSLPLVLIGLALSFYSRLSQGLKHTVLLVLGVQESVLLPLAPALAVIFVFMSVAMNVAWSAFLSGFWAASTLRALSEAVRALSDVNTLIVNTMTRIVDIVRPPSEPGKANADLAAITHELEQAASAMIREAEQRLRSEWRFVVGLISAVILGAVAIFATLLGLRASP